MADARATCGARAFRAVAFLIVQGAGVSDGVHMPQTMDFAWTPSLRGDIYRLDARGNPFETLDQSFGPGKEDNNITAKAMMGVEGNAQGDAEVLKSAFVFNAIAWFGVMAAFCFLLRVYPAVYSRYVDADGHVPQQSPTSWFEKLMFYMGWLPDVNAMTPRKVIAEAGLDACTLLDYHSLMRWILASITPGIVLVLCPLHLKYGKNTPEVDKLSRLGINNLPQGSPIFWVHAFYVWYVVIVVIGFLLEAQNQFVQYRYQWLRDMPVPQAKTMLVENIPYQYRSDRKLRAFFEQLFGKDAIDRVYVVRRSGFLYTINRQVETLAAKLEIAQRAEDDEEVEKLEIQIAAEQEKAVAERVKLTKQVKEYESSSHVADHVKQINKAELSCAPEAEEPKEDSHAFSASAFVTFTTRKWCRTAIKEQYSAYRDAFKVSTAPAPDDVYYGNLALLPHERDNLDMVGRLSILGIFFFWFPAVVFLTGLTSLRSFQDKIPWVRQFCETQPALEAILEGICSTLALKLFMGLLPTVLLFIIRQFFTSTAGAMAQYHMHSWFYAFQVIFVVLVTAIGRSLFATARDLMERPGMVIDLLAISMPTSSHFYMQYVILGWFAVALEQLRLSNLLKYIFFRSFLPPEKAKERSEPEAPDAYGLGCRFAKATSHGTIAFCFCTCSPLICIFSWIYYRLGSITYTYLLCKAETKKPDIGGYFWVQALDQTMFGLALFVVLMVGILEERAATVKPGLVAGSSMFVVYWGWRKMRAINWLTRALPEIVKDDKEFAKNAPTPVGEYIQIDLTAKK